MGASTDQRWVSRFFLVRIFFHHVRAHTSSATPPHTGCVPLLLLASLPPEAAGDPREFWQDLGLSGTLGEPQGQLAVDCRSSSGRCRGGDWTRLRSIGCRAIGSRLVGGGQLEIDWRSIGGSEVREG
jgi:hypothetical protein